MRAALLLVLLPCVASANVIWRGDFETNDFSQWDSYITNPQDWSVVTSPVDQGTYAARLALGGGDYFLNGIRGEISHTPDLADFQNQERWYSWASMISSDAPIDAHDHQLMFWECDAPLYQQEMSFHIEGTQLIFATSPQGGSYQERWHDRDGGGQMSTGVWHHFMLHVMWSLDSSVGFVEFYFDGRLVVPKVMMKTMHDNSGTPLTSTFHHGIFLGTEIDAGEPTEIAFLDNVLEGETMNDVMQPSEMPDAGAPDSGVPDSGTTDAGSISANDGGLITIPDAGGGSDAGLSSSPDAGDGSGTVDGGCNCNQAAGVLVLLAALALRKRKGNS